MKSSSSTEDGYDARRVAWGSPPLNQSPASSSSSTKTSITRTGLSSPIQSSRHSGNSVLCPRSVPSTKRFIRSPRKSRRNHTASLTSTSPFSHSQGQNANSSYVSGMSVYEPVAHVSRRSEANLHAEVAAGFARAEAADVEEDDALAAQSRWTRCCLLATQSGSSSPLRTVRGARGRSECAATPH